MNRISSVETTLFSDSIKLYFRLIGTSVKSQMQYPASFLMLSITHFFSTFVDIFGIWVLFDRFKMVKGWTLPEMALIYGIIQMGFAIAEGAARGFDTFAKLIKSGDFDRILLRPRGTLFQIASCDFQGMRIGRLLQGFTVLLWSSYTLGIPLFSLRGAILILSVIGAASLFYALFVIQATLAFWTTETLELMNIATYGGLESGQYPMSIYPVGFRFIFTFIIPLACIAYYPVAMLLQHENNPLWVGGLYPLAGVLFLVAATQFWKIGVRRYQSAGG